MKWFPMVFLVGCETAEECVPYDPGVGVMACDEVYICCPKGGVTEDDLCAYETDDGTRYECTDISCANAVTPMLCDVCASDPYVGYLGC